MSYLKSAAAAVKNPPQSEPLNERQIQNSAGGYSFAVTDWVRLDRFLILGSERGSYYASERKLTKENAEGAIRCIKADGIRVVNRVVEISHFGLAPKNDPALFVLALCAAAEDANVRKAALAALPSVARIGTHLFHFAEYVNSLRGWGRGLRGAIANWYLSKPLGDLQNQLVKYQQRDGWGHSDLLRLAHPRGTFAHDAAFRWALGKGVNDDIEVKKFSKGHKEEAKTFSYKGVRRPGVNVSLPLIEAFEAAKTATVKELLPMIRENGLTREMVPTEALKSPEVWEALLEKMPMTAMVRNLATMTRVGLLKPLSDASKSIVSRLGDRESIRKARVHPIQMLMALKTYGAGKGVRSRAEGWTPVQSVVDALDEAFYLAFDNVEPTDKRWYIGLDVSGSMGSGDVAGIPNFTPREASAAMCLVTARAEKEHVIYGFQDKMKKVGISPKDRLNEAVRRVSNLSFGGTDCSLPMIHALEEGFKVDTFAVYTDSETWAGMTHPVKALENYRQKTGINAKLIVVGMVSNEFTIADPNDAGMLDVVGFDASAPALMSQFAKE
jgi:60 kDa SS-A/Ro ribonucleoprotein